MSIRKIADAIEYSAPVIYDHFANKEAILLKFHRMALNCCWQTFTGLFPNKNRRKRS
ncbi:TetR/AcrR family transcriptional regulator [Niabella defluvii]|nr:TetR/AcrR family transcriptional regulator [Niabella sp. I65]